MPTSEGFVWEASVYLRTGAYTLDMHNDFDFTAVSHSLARREAVLEWARSPRPGVVTTQPSRLTLTIHDVTHFEVRPRDPEMPFTEDDCLSSFGYLSKDEWCDGQFWTDATPDPAWHWSFEFQSRAEVVIEGGIAKIAIEL